MAQTAMKQLADFFAAELILIRAARETEKEKNRAIMKGDGKRLALLTSKSESWLVEIDRLAEERIRAMRAVWDNLGPTESESLSLRDLERRLAGLEDKEATRLMELAGRYRAELTDLYALNQENQLLLVTTSQSIQRVLADIQEAAQPEKDAYQPGDKRTRRGPANSILLNANA